MKKLHYVEIPTPPEGATHYNPMYSLCWEHHDKGNRYLHYAGRGWVLDESFREDGHEIQEVVIP
tara:strand:+ start:202 stop:393 length:192 start_codon:yes stop_codon:yes gene_type:complete